MAHWGPGPMLSLSYSTQQDALQFFQFCGYGKHLWCILQVMSGQQYWEHFSISEGCNCQRGWEHEAGHFVAGIEDLVLNEVHGGQIVKGWWPCHEPLNRPVATLQIQRCECYWNKMDGFWDVMKTCHNTNKPFKSRDEVTQAMSEWQVHRYGSESNCSCPYIGFGNVTIWKPREVMVSKSTARWSSSATGSTVSYPLFVNLIKGIGISTGLLSGPLNSCGGYLHKECYSV